MNALVLAALLWVGADAPISPTAKWLAETRTDREAARKKVTNPDLAPTPRSTPTAERCNGGSCRHSSIGYVISANRGCCGKPNVGIIISHSRKESLDPTDPDYAAKLVEQARREAVK